MSEEVAVETMRSVVVALAAVLTLMWWAGESVVVGCWRKARTWQDAVARGVFGNMPMVFVSVAACPVGNAVTDP